MSQLSGNDHWAYFGDSHAAQVVDTKEFIRKTGVKYVRFILIPSRLIEQTYDLDEDQDPSTRAIVKEYPATDVIWLTRGIGRSRCWILTDFEGGQTEASRHSEELAVTLRDTERMMRSAEAAKNRAYQELEKERQQQLQAMQTKIDMVRAVARARGRLEEGDEGISVDQQE